MTNDNSTRQFQTLSLVFTYIFLKEKYPSLKDPAIRERQDVDVIYERLREYEAYAHVPNKKKFILEGFDHINSHGTDDEFDEEELLTLVRQLSVELDPKQREEIFRSLVQAAKADNHISADEKEVICQVGVALKIENPQQWLSSQKTWIGIAVAALLFFSVAGFAYYLYSSISGGGVNTYRRENIVFSEVFFNRFLIYKNRFNVESDWMRRQAVFYLNGSAEIAFEPSQISYDESSGTLSLACSSAAPDSQFQMIYHFDDPVIVDQVDPRPISESEAKTAASVIGIAGSALGVTAGAKFGSVLSSFAPKQYKFVTQAGAGALAGLAGGLGGYYFALDSLTGTQLTKDISPAEILVITQAAMDIIKAALEAEGELTNIFEERFQTFIQAEYAERGKNISRVSFDCNVNEEGA